MNADPGQSPHRIFTEHGHVSDTVFHGSSPAICKRFCEGAADCHGFVTRTELFGGVQKCYYKGASASELVATKYPQQGSTLHVKLVGSAPPAPPPSPPPPPPPSPPSPPSAPTVEIDAAIASVTHDLLDRASTVPWYAWGVLALAAVVCVIAYMCRSTPQAAEVDDVASLGEKPTRDYLLQRKQSFDRSLHKKKALNGVNGAPPRSPARPTPAKLHAAQSTPGQSTPGHLTPERLRLFESNRNEHLPSAESITCTPHDKAPSADVEAGGGGVDEPSVRPPSATHVALERKKSFGRSKKGAGKPGGPPDGGGTTELV